MRLGAKVDLLGREHSGVRREPRGSAFLSYSFPASLSLFYSQNGISLKQSKAAPFIVQGAAVTTLKSYPLTTPRFSPFFTSILLTNSLTQAAPLIP